MIEYFWQETNQVLQFLKEVTHLVQKVLNSGVHSLSHLCLLCAPGDLLRNAHGKNKKIHKAVKSGHSSVASYADANIPQLHLTWILRLLTQAGLTTLKNKRLTDTSETPSENDYPSFLNTVLKQINILKNLTC